MQHNWYKAVSTNLANLPSCVEYYEKELIEAKKEMAIKGKSIERSQSELPGIVEQRFTQLQEIEAILEFVNIKYREIRSNAFKKYLEKYAKDLTSRDADKYCDGDREVVDMAIIVNEVALLRNKFLAMHKGLDQKSYMLGHITRLKCAGLDDASVN